MKIEQIKRKIKHYTPEIIVGATLGLAIVGIVKMRKSSVDETIRFTVTPEMLQMMNDGKSALLFHTIYGSFIMKNVD